MTMTRHLFFATLALFALLFAGATHAQSRPAPLVEGEDYVTIAQGIPFAQAKGKVEIAEVFGYWCHHCNDFQPMVDAWKPRLPAGVDFVYVPATFDPEDPFARAYFAARRGAVTNGARIVLLNQAYQQLLPAPKPAPAAPKM